MHQNTTAEPVEDVGSMSTKETNPWAEDAVPIAVSQLLTPGAPTMLSENHSQTKTLPTATIATPTRGMLNYEATSSSEDDDINNEQDQAPNPNQLGDWNSFDS